MKKHTWYELFQGELTDAPGRCESWTDELCYLGNEEWLWREQGTDFSGQEETQSEGQKWSSENLVEFILERDYYELESPTYVYGYIENLKEQGLDSEVLGPRALNLRDIANKVGSKYCFEKINQDEKESIDKLEEDFEEWEDEIELTEHEILEQKKMRKITKSIWRLIDQYEFPSNLSISFGARPSNSNKKIWRERTAIRDCLCSFSEKFYNENKKIPSGIHMISGVDKHMKEPIGFVDFDELELKAKNQENDEQ
jgi:hypothetical protein